MPTDFNAFFKAAFTDQREPYGYQQRLAAEPCISRLINVPTGLGKTAAVILSWLWNRRQPNSVWPRRLVYCLPMGTLVEQTRDESARWLKHLGLTDAVGLHIFMGGEESEPWDLYPEKDSILIGTQINDTRSVMLILFDGEKVRSAGNVTIPPNHDMPKPGDVVECRYLYAFKESGSIYQPVFLGVRDDIQHAECTTAQLKYKAP